VKALSKNKATAGHLVKHIVNWLESKSLHHTESTLIFGPVQ
jgi:hypothetical protein